MWTSKNIRKCQNDKWNSPLTFGIISLILVIAADRITKWIVLDVYQINAFQPRKITPFLDLTLVYNRGISYGWFQQENIIGYLALIIIGIAISAMLAVWMFKVKIKTQTIALGAIIGGALSNVYDRIIYGAVIDFISLHAFNVYWYVFNIADAAIVVATIYLCFTIMRDTKKPQ